MSRSEVLEAQPVITAETKQAVSIPSVHPLIREYALLFGHKEDSPEYLRIVGGLKKTYQSTGSMGLLSFKIHERRRELAREKSNSK